MKAPVAGIPLVILPHGRDQADTAMRVVARGAGVKLPRAAIAAAIVVVLADDRRRAAALALGAAIARDMDDTALLRELESADAIAPSGVGIQRT